MTCITFTVWETDSTISLRSRWGSSTAGARRLRRGTRKRLHISCGLTPAALGQRRTERRHLGRWDAVRHDVDERRVVGCVTQPTPQIWSGPAFAVGAVAPRALRVEDLLAGRQVGRRSKLRGPGLGCAGRGDERQRPGDDEKKGMSLHEADYSDTTRRRAARPAFRPDRAGRFADPARADPARCAR